MPAVVLMSSKRYSFIHYENRTSVLRNRLENKKDNSVHNDSIQKTIAAKSSTDMYKSEIILDI